MGRGRTRGTEAGAGGTPPRKRPGWRAAGPVRGRRGVRCADRSRGEPGKRMPAPLPGATRRRTNLGGRRGGRMSTSGDAGLGVGPVLHATPFARSVVSVIEEENTHVLVRGEAAYLRVLVPRVCRLARAGLEAATGLALRVPRDLEAVMSAFTGVIQLTEDRAVWPLPREPSAETAAPLAGGR